MVYFILLFGIILFKGDYVTFVLFNVLYIKASFLVSQQILEDEELRDVLYFLRYVLWGENSGRFI
jgi:hypothetical protein